MEKLILGFIGYNKKVKDICLCKHCM
jgi:5'-methylthioadenosine phosphorylase